MRQALLVSGIIVSLAVSWVGVWIAGHWFGELEERRLRFEEERNLLEPVLASDPVFEGVEIVPATGPGGGILLLGTVNDRAALARLKAELVRLLGEPRAKCLLSIGPSVQSDAQRRHA